MDLSLDLECPANTNCELRPARARKWHHRIETDTPIVPHAVAVMVWEEASLWLDAELPREWIGILAERADVIYAHNRAFRHRIRRRGTAGRDCLWAFTRHWLAGLIWRRRRELYAHLPTGYNVGQPLPPATRKLIRIS